MKLGEIKVIDGRRYQLVSDAAQGKQQGECWACAFKLDKSTCVKSEAALACWPGSIFVCVGEEKGGAV